MKTVRHYGTARDKRLHIETEGCIVNIQIGLTDNEGRAVTSVTILPDDESRGGDGEQRIWRVDGNPGILHARVIREPEVEALKCLGCGKANLDTHACPNSSTHPDVQEGGWKVRAYCVDCCGCPDHTEEVE